MQQNFDGVYGQQQGGLGDSEGEKGDWAVVPFQPRPTFDLEVANILFNVNLI